MPTGLQNAAVGCEALEKGEIINLSSNRDKLSAN